MVVIKVVPSVVSKDVGPAVVVPTIVVVPCGVEPVTWLVPVVP